MLKDGTMSDLPGAWSECSIAALSAVSSNVATAGAQNCQNSTDQFLAQQMMRRFSMPIQFNNGVEKKYEYVPGPDGTEEVTLIPQGDGLGNANGIYHIASAPGLKPQAHPGEAPCAMTRRAGAGRLRDPHPVRGRCAEGGLGAFRL